MVMGEEGSTELVDLIISLGHAPNESDITLIKSLGGEVFEQWDNLIYAMHVSLPTSAAETYITQNPSVVLIEENAKMNARLEYSTYQIRARPFVWNSYSYTGSSNQSIAILDTGVDDSHADLSGKVIGWSDFIGASESISGDEYISPRDKGEHGTHVASIAAGSGTAGGLSSGTDRINITFSGTFPPVEGNGRIEYFQVNTSGSSATINARLNWTADVAGDWYWIEIYNNTGSVSGSASGNTPLFEAQATVPANTDANYSVAFGTMSGDGVNTAGTDYISQVEAPYVAFGDGHPLLTGVAPDTNIVGLKVLDDTGNGTVASLINALEWTQTNASTYGIVVASMSLGWPADTVISSIDTAINNLVSSGIVAVVAAGNDGRELNPYIASPGTAAKAITVGAVSDLDKIADYSSLGKSSRSPLKPDVVAPGGSVITHNKILAADTNDADRVWNDQYSNDYKQMHGTSMATPHVSGLVGLVADSMGEWCYTEDNALRTKMLVLMTAFEVQEGELNVPSLNRGAKDNIEGYGRVSADAIVEAVIFNYNVGDIATDTFGPNPEDKKVWVKQLYLGVGEYTFNLTVPVDADYDLYIYDGFPDVNGEPQIVKNSTNTGDINENIIITTATPNMYYIVVKWVEGSGTFSLTSSGMGSLNQNSLQSGESALYVIPIGATLNPLAWYNYKGPLFVSTLWSDSGRNMKIRLAPSSGYTTCNYTIGTKGKVAIGSNNHWLLSPGYGIWVLNITETGSPTNPDFNFTSNYLGQMYSMPTKLDVTSIDMFAGSNSTPLQIEFEVNINNGAEPFTYAPYSSPTQSNFDIKIGGKEVQALAVIELSQDRYKLTVLPPTQSSEGKYDLSINFTFEKFGVASSAYAFLGDAVEYGTGTGTTTVDVALVIDSSGSMGGNDPSDLRKDAAKYFVDFLKNGDAAAVVDFDSNVVTWAHLTEIQGQSDKDVLKAAIDNIDSSGWTAIGYGLQAGYDELNTVVIQNTTEVQQVVESPHPYTNNYDNTWIINYTHNTSRFLTLPFKDPDIKIQQGWVYTFDPDPDTHKGIDYIKGTIDQSSTWQSFDVVAAADGVAMQSSGGGYGTFVYIRHNEKDSTGNNYFTLYAHLDSVATGIVSKPRGDTNYSAWTPVKRGEVVGRAGNTEASWTGIHLHFEVQRGGYAQNKTDPYDLYKTRDFYPGGVNYTNSGPNHLWTTDPPSYTLTEAKYIRVHFVNMSTESGYDYVYIRNENDTIIATYNGYYTDVWSPWVEGDTIKVQLTSDGVIAYYGFYIDKYEYAQTSYGANRKAAILLTDGYQNTGTHPNDVVPLYKAKGWPIYTIALTGDADEDLLKNIASETGGKFEKAETADALTEIYNELKRVVKKQSTIQSLSGAISQNQSIASSVNVDSSVQSFDVSVSWPGSDLDLFLYYPNGSPVGLNASSQTGTNDPNITYTSAATYEIYTVTNPMPGNWTYNITAVQVTGNESFTAGVAASTTTMLTMGTDKAVYHKNEPIIISATFMNSSGGIEGANVTATVTQPSSYAETVELSDTGSGTYKVTYTNTSVAGSYSISVEATKGGISRVSSTDVDVNTSTAGINATPSTGFGSAYPGDSVSLSITIADIVGGTGGGTLSLAFEHFLKELGEKEMKTGAQSVESKTMKSLAVHALQSGQTSAVINVGDLIGANGTIGASNVVVSQPVVTLVSGQSVNVTMTLNVPYDVEEGNYTGTIQVISSKGNVLVHANVSIDKLTGDAVITQISGDLASWYNAMTSAEKAYYIERTADKLLIWFYSP